MARLFDNALSQVVNVQGAQSQLDNLVPFTYTAWVYRTANTVTGRIVQKGDGTFKNFTENTAIVSSSFSLTVGRGSGGGTNAFALAAANTLPLSVWRFVACTFDETDGPRLYIATPGGSVSEVTYNSAPIVGVGTVNDDSAGELCIGARNAAGQSPIAARIADVRVFNAKLSLSDLNAIKGGALVRGPRGWWPLWGSQSPEPDWSGNNNHGTVNGATKVDGPPGYSAQWVRPTRRVEVAHAVGGPVTTTRQQAGKANIFKQTTATKLYVTSSPIGSSGYGVSHGAWDDYSIGIVSTLKPFPSGVTASSVQFTDTTPNRDVELARWVSDPIKAYNFTAIDTVEWVLGVRTGLTTLNGVFHVHIWVYQGSTETERGTLLSDFIGADLWTTTATGRTEGIINLSPVSAQNGDRIGIEVGYRSNAPGSASGRVHYGGAGGDDSGVIIEMGVSPVPLGEVINDLTQGSTNVTTERGWIELVTSAPLFTPATHTIDGKSRIIGRVSQNQTGKASIFVAATTKTITGKAAIKVTTTKTQTGKGYIAIETFAATQDQQGLSRIKRTEIKTISGISNIATPSQSARTIVGVASIQASTTRDQTGTGSISRSVVQSISGQSKIHATVSQPIDGKASIIVFGTTIQEISGVASIEVHRSAQITGVAFILTTTVTQRSKVKVKGR